MAVIASANVLANGFAYDDTTAIAQNDSIHDIRALPRALTQPYWTNGMGKALGIWRPGATALFGTEWALWGDRPLPYHVVGLALHGADVGVATLLMAEIAPVGAAFLGGLVFAVHPVHVEAVANVVGQAELLCALFLFLSCLLYVRAPPGEALGGGRMVALVALYALAFLSKENGAVLPGLLVLLDAWRERLTVRDIPSYLRRRAPLFGALVATAVAVLALRIRVLGGVTGAFPALGADLLTQVPRIWTLPIIWLNYVRLLFFPADLVPDYSPSVIDVQLGWNAQNAAGVVLVLTILALAWAVWRSATVGSGAPGESGTGSGDSPNRARPAVDDDASPVTLGILWFGIAVLPVSNVLFLAGILLAERTLYVPSFGFALGVGSALWLLRLRRPRLAAAVTAAAVLALGARSWTGDPVWNSTGTVFNHLLRKHPESGRIQWLVADHLWTSLGRREEALDAYRLAVGINGATYPLLVEIAHRLLVYGAPEQSARLAEMAWKAHPDLEGAPTTLATALSQEGKDREALEPALAALRQDPDNALLHHIAAVGYRAEGSWRRAIVHRKAAIDNGEGGRWIQWRWLADLELRAGDTVSAVAAVDSALDRAGEASARRTLDSLKASLSPDATVTGTGGGNPPRRTTEDDAKSL